MPQEDLLKRSIWIWPNSYWRPAESAWLTAHKFGFLNAIDGRVLGRVLASVDPSGEHLPKSAPARLFNRIAEERKYGNRPGGRHDVLRAHTLDELFGSHRRAICAPYVRFCAVCLERWFHSSIHQIEGLRTCPFHGVDLVSACPGCGMKIFLDGAPEYLQQPLHCHGCGRPFAGREPLFSDLFAVDEDKASKSAACIQKEIESICRSRSVSGVDSSRAFPGGDAAYFEVLFAGTPVRQRLETANDSRWLKVQVHEVPLLPVRRATLRSDFAAAVAWLRSIGRHLARRVQGHCGHRRPKPLLIDRGDCEFVEPCWLSIGVPIGHATKPPDLCACCLVLARWRVSFSLVFHMYEKYRTAEWTDADEAVACLEEASTALAVFSLCVVQTAHAIGLDLSAAGSPEGGGHNDELTACLQVWPPLSWCIPRRTDRQVFHVAGYNAVQVDQLLARLAGISLRPHSRQFEISLGSTSTSAWGQCIAEHKLKLTC
ncbi:hypothetical protein WDL1P2_00199 (plasmid) [Variovorax sp. WDL1]|nr:hypothetical protein CHC07_06702 [Variovorax sp. B4]PNG49785.1 hypothetical protein CHC06_05366 [Variovorax sp. B2]VTV17828.1 hypothetical protein WDL1P1_00693 [Variovorax sp. WDL1]PNG50632.1 hypothetical protein CHC06_06256 [Variovorax sp. B2]PNG50657.1 hypothetical protein CHC07_05271 [Variovorax sp. B4]